MIKKVTFLKAFLINCFLLLQALQMHSQCTLPFTVPPNNTSWGTFNRVSYTGGWMLNSSQTAYRDASTNRTVLTPSQVHNAFGVNDYTTDANFSGVTAPLSSPIIRVGQRIDVNSSVAMPSGAANFASFTFTPTATNSKIRIYYIGAGESTFNSASVRTDKFNSGQGNYIQPRFGAVCQYNYTPCNGASTVTGMNEFGLQTPNSLPNPTAFSNTTNRLNFGKNDLFAGIQAGSTASTSPLNTLSTDFTSVSGSSSSIRKMTAWKSYVLDFSEFVGLGSVTVTLFSHCSSASNSLFDAYSYYQFACEGSGSVTPISDLIIQNINDSSTNFNLGCKNASANNYLVLNGITNNFPINTAAVFTSSFNNQVALPWLSLPNSIYNTSPTSTIPSQLFSNNFATLVLERLKPDGTWVSHNDIYHATRSTSGDYTALEDININLGTGPINATGFTAATGTTAEYYYYTFRVRYKTMNMCSEVVSNNFNVNINYVAIPPCATNESAPSIYTNPSLLVNTGTSNQNVYCDGNFDILLGPADCTNLLPGSGFYFLRYQWERAMPGVAWENIAVTSQNLLNAQDFISPNHCNTIFRRRCITASTCTDNTIATTSEATSAITIWNKKFIPIRSPISATVTPFSSGSSTSLTNASVIEVCYGDTININSTFNLGNFTGGCAGPNLGTNNQLFLQVVNPTTGQVYVDNNYTYNGYSTTGSYSFNFVANTANGFSPTASNVEMTLLLKIRTIFDGCERVDFREINLVVIRVKPRAVGGAIEVSPASCPLDVVNVSSVYSNSFGNLYNWYYSLDNVTWTLIAPSALTTGQNIDLAVMAIIPVARPYYLRRESRAFASCPTTAFSNTIYIPNTPRTIPLFTLPELVCKGSILNLPATSNNGIQGTWHLITSFSPVVYNLANQPNPVSTVVTGIRDYIFIPDNPSATNGFQCADYYIYHLEIVNWVTPTFSFDTSLCIGDTFTLPTTSDNGITGTWSPAVVNTAIGMNPTTFYFTPTNTTPSQCAFNTTATITVYPRIPNFGLPTSLCQFDTAIPLPANPALGQVWNLISINGVTQSPAPVVTSINTNTPGTFVYQYSANYVCDSPATHTVVINLKITPVVSLPTTICYGETAPILPATPSGITGTWSPSVVSTTASGTYTFTPAAGQCAFGTSYSLTVLPIPSAGTLSSSSTTIYAGLTTTVTPTVAGGTWASSNTAIATVSATGIVTGVSAGVATITYTITGANGCTSATTIDITVEQLNSSCTATTVWNGTSWSNGIPNTPAYLNTAVIFTANFNTTEDLYACTVLVTNNAEVKVKHIGSLVTSNQAHTFTVSNQIVVHTGAKFEFEDDASLVQINDIANTGNIKYTRQTPRINKFDYTYWCSPVAGQTLVGLSPDTLSDKFFWWNPLLPNWVNIINTAVMETGKGYIIRGPQGFDPGTNYFFGNFIGVPNNGTLTTTVHLGTSTTYANSAKANLIGNPYPSALDIDCFLSDPLNAHLGGAIYLWSHNIPIDWSGATNQPFPGGALYNYNVNSYATYNRLGGVGTGITSIVDGIFSSDRSLGKVGAGQGFFIETTTSGDAYFKNSMRVGSQLQQNSQFFRGTPLPAESSPCVSEERHRLWIQIRNLTPAQQFKQTLLGYSPLATTSTTLDRNYDAKTLVAEPYTINLYTLSPANDQLTIQGRALTTPFNENDVIPLGFTCKLNTASPTNTIQIATSEFDGLFNTTNFYLRETLVGGGYAYYDIKTTPYEFPITADVIDNTTRFAIVFTNPTFPKMTSNTPKKELFSVTMSPNPFDKGFTLQLQSPVKEKVTVTIFDILGKKISSTDFSFEELPSKVLGTNLSSGVYQAVITQGEYKETIKIIKN
jgi:hypothetical protein